MNLQRGAGLVEVLVTVLILAFGLLGLAGLQSRLQASDTESYQRAQALVLLEDMASRIGANRSAAVAYVTGAAAPMGAGITCPVAAATRAEIDLAQWCNALQGTAEISGTSRVGAMLSARGCVEALPDNEYLVTVAWQGMSPAAAPDAGTACGANSYDDTAADAVCVDGRCRRLVTTVVRIGTL